MLIKSAAGDTSQNLLWRLKNGEAPEGLAPQAVVILIGTNDLSKSFGNKVSALRRSQEQQSSTSLSWKVDCEMESGTKLQCLSSSLKLTASVYGSVVLLASFFHPDRRCGCSWTSQRRQTQLLRALWMRPPLCSPLTGRRRWWCWLCCPAATKLLKLPH